MMNKDVLIELMEKMQVNKIRELIITHDRVEIRSGCGPSAPDKESAAPKLPETAPAIPAQAAAPVQPAADTRLVEIKAPLPGTVFIAPGTDNNKKPLPAKGAAIREGEVIALVEAMKMFNEVFAPVSGVIEEFRVAHQSAVKVGDVLMTIRSA